LIRVESPDVSILIPALNEAENLPLLVPRITEALRGRTHEILIIDDQSHDDTVNVCAELAQSHALRLIVRERPRHGLSGAVLEGMRQAKGTLFLVMDADLQHPPERIPALLEPLESDQADFTLGSRYVPGGGTADAWSLARRINSAVATWLARPFCGSIRDPMSGFFALKRRTFEQAQRLTPLGYKIALELMCKCRITRPMEIPIHFDLRQKGESKLTLQQQFRYLEHLSRLYDFQYPRASPIIKFLIVLLLSWTAGAMLYGALMGGGVRRLIATPLSYLAALAVTALFHARYAHTQREFLVRQSPWLDFVLISLCEWAACWAAAAWLAWRIPRHQVPELFIVPFACATVVRYVLRKELLADIRGLRNRRSEER
jgi:dolichol-phosphate mannosyltransferase